MTEVERRFDHNLRVAHAAHKVTKIKATSREALRKLPFESYDLVYLDGSHMAADVLEDAVLSFPLLKPGGILIFDDYQLVRDRELTVPTNRRRCLSAGLSRPLRDSPPAIPNYNSQGDRRMRDKGNGLADNRSLDGSVRSRTVRLG